MNRQTKRWTSIAVIVALAANMVVQARAGASECRRSPAEVQGVHGVSAWSGWSRNVDGHKGEKCYFLSKREHPSHPARSQERAAAKREKPAPAAAPVQHLAMSMNSPVAVQTAAVSERLFRGPLAIHYPVTDFREWNPSDFKPAWLAVAFQLIDARQVTGVIRVASR